MADGYPLGPICTESSPLATINEDGTLCRAASAIPGPVSGQIQQPTYVTVVPELKTAVDITFNLAAPTTWDAFWRSAYDKINSGFQRQADEWLKRGIFTQEEVRGLVDARNRELLRIRNQLTPFGRLYSEVLKPAASLPNLEKLLAEKGSIRAVLESAGKTRVVVDRLAIVSRVAGPALIGLDVVLTSVVIVQASPEERSRVTAEEVGGLAGGVGFGMAGFWAGCATFAAYASPTLTIPVVGEVTTGTACLVGGFIVGGGLGYAGRKSGRAIGSAAYDWVTCLTWQ
ncbi:hypothetical protein [Nitrosospira sp. Nsp13]|uniref:hypothetical protein n=1 Tax=Nitrosospira sp. Nsp13 TaxID=1855332 RepID=UPI00088477D0|nr:hypothetical protein [Nitrosospira sp. Nsp13]SCX77805.1 hypothetical protein SAMN05216308_101146 [Nitrosospira sp. Nsp13]